MSRPQRTARFDFRKHCAVVTGAAGALGRATTFELAEVGATVLAVDRDEAAVTALAAELSDHGLAVTPFVADVRDRASVFAYAEAAARLGGGNIDLFFNNAGVEGNAATLETMRLDDLRDVFETNVVGVALGIQAVLPRMRSGGAIVNTASVAATRGAAGMASYVASKHAVLGLTRTAAIEAAERGVRVNAICPGGIEGRMMRSIDEQRQRLLPPTVAYTSGRTYAAPSDVARVVLFLLSDAATLLNGQALQAEL